MSGFALKAFGCFADLTDGEREAFSEVCQELAVDAGEQVFVSGEEADGLLLLAAGRLRIDGRGDLSAVVGPGATLGALSLVVPGPREVSATALEPCRVFWLPRTGFRRIADDAPHAAVRFLEHVLADLVTAVRPGLPHLLAVAVDPAQTAE